MKIIFELINFFFFFLKKITSKIEALKRQKKKKKKIYLEKYLKYQNSSAPINRRTKVTDQCHVNNLIKKTTDRLVRPIKLH